MLFFMIFHNKNKCVFYYRKYSISKTVLLVTINSYLYFPKYKLYDILIIPKPWGSGGTRLRRGKFPT